MGAGGRVQDVVMAIKDEYNRASKTAIEKFASQVLSKQTPPSFKKSHIELAFNFAGRMQQGMRNDSVVKLRTDGPPVHLENVTGECEAVRLSSIYASIEKDERPALALDYNRHMAHQDRIVRWMKEELGNCFTEMISILSGSSFTLTASDLPLFNMSPGSSSIEYLHSQLEELGVAQNNVESIYPCTATQDGILFAQLNGHDYHNRFIVRLTSNEGDVDIDKVADAWKAVCQAHPILRTIFTTGRSDQSAFQQISLKHSQPSISARQVPKDGSTISKMVESQQNTPLDPKQPPHHLTLYQEPGSVAYAVVDVSHTLADTKTFQGLFNTIRSVYSKNVSGEVMTVDSEGAREYWKNYLQGVNPYSFPQDLTAPLDYEARGPIVPFKDAQRLNRFCQEQGVTNAMFMQAAWALVLRKCTSNTTVCFGSVRSDQEVLPNNGSLDSLAPVNVLETAQNYVSQSMSYSGCYLAELHDELGLKDSPLFDTIMTIQRAWSTDLGDGSGGLSIEIMDADDSTEYSVVVGVQYSKSGLTIRLSYQRARVSDRPFDTRHRKDFCRDVPSDRLAYRLRDEQGVRGDDIVPFCCIKAASAVVIMLAILKAGAAFLPLGFSNPNERLSAILEETGTKLVLVNATDRAEKMKDCFPIGTVDLVQIKHLEDFDKSEDDIRRELSSYTIEPQHAGYVVYTSGSTGQPKGLILHHKSLATSTMYHAPRLGITPQTRLLQLNSFIFDFALLDVIFSLYAGACICMPSEDEAANHDAPTLKTVVLAGEAMKQENMKTWASHARIMNAYGPGETGMSSCGDVTIGEDGSFIQDIGAPFGCRYWVVDPDSHDELVPIGTVGELVIEGPIVGRGYVNKPEATAAAFIDPPAWTKYTEFSNIELGQHRFYKSGDLVSQRSKDSFVVEGRKDYQVKIRGQRIEMREIEHHLNQQTLGVSEWAVEVIQAGANEETSLAAFCQFSTDGILPSNEGNVLPPFPETAEEAREALREAVPSYMVPEFFIPLIRIPTTGPMKTDRKALRAIASSFQRNGDLEKAASPAVLTGFESVLQQAWAGLLSLPAESIQPSNDFFALGGNSIRAMRLVATLRASGHLLSVADIFKFPTLSAMARKVSSLPSYRNGSAPKAVIAMPYDIPQLQILAKTKPWLDKSNIETIAPATDLQCLMLSEAHHPDGGSMVATVTLEPLAKQEKPYLDTVRLQKACEKIIRFHAILRTVFAQNDQSLMQLALKTVPVKQNAYNGSEILPRQPSFHEWSSHASDAERLAESRRFWQDLLKDSMSYPLAPTNSARQKNEDSNAQSYRVSIQVPVANLESLNGTVATVLKAAWSCVFSQVLEKDDLVFSFLSASRFSRTLSHGSAEQVPGPCINLAPVRAFTGDNKTMAMLIRDLQEQSNESLAHQHMGFCSIAKDCSQWPTSRFNSAILFQNHEAFGQALRFGGTECTITGAGEGTSSADVWITATPQSDEAISIELRFSQSKVPAELCQWVARCFESLLKSLPCYWERKICDLQEQLMSEIGPNPLSLMQRESYGPRSGAFSFEDAVDGVLEVGHFKYA
ncbi:hypothetical protein F53441_669 [Fusarium austroafricanum]|uniref:Carrier domain-containing protein n=1 Tax=Fusarium austroafricanum TaxID=2364996 RepID=A0A8H4P5Z8_9HYPO|nr:hypothetical protein F53441_669 [Fusarium austroafricanum]